MVVDARFRQLDVRVVVFGWGHLSWKPLLVLCEVDAIVLATQSKSEREIEKQKKTVMQKFNGYNE